MRRRKGGIEMKNTTQYKNLIQNEEKERGKESELFSL
jgi:hypothetical protein